MNAPRQFIDPQVIARAFRDGRAIDNRFTGPPHTYRIEDEPSWANFTVLDAIVCCVVMAMIGAMMAGAF